MLKIYFFNIILLFWLSQFFVCTVSSSAEPPKKKVVFPVVDYLENKPIIDGLLDDDVVDLPERNLPFAVKTQVCIRTSKDPPIKRSRTLICVRGALSKTGWRMKWPGEKFRGL